MNFTRNLKLGTSGDDVLYIKKKLYDLEMYTKNITKVSSKVFKSDTEDAVEKYQRTHKDVNGDPLDVDGIIGKLTWYAVERDWADLQGNDKPSAVTEIIKPADYPHISAAKIRLINADLQGLTAERINTVKEALKFCTDPDMPGEYPKSFYIRGGNIYNPDLKVNTMTKAKLASYFKKSAYAPYFSSGRKEMMLEAAEAQNYMCSGADCSGGVVGILRMLKEVKATFDMTANGLCSSSCSVKVSKANRKPADWIWKSEHIGIYVGADLVVEWAGGAYGCQLSNATGRRRLYDYVDKEIVSLTGWTSYHDPVYY